MSNADAMARREALDPTRSFCVTAPAGSGKTELLTQRILALLTRVERPEQVLAITFTRKAAAEMRERLMLKIEQARAGTPVAAEHEQITRDLATSVLAHAEHKGWSLDPQLFNLRTIDSLCGELTRQMPVLSALGGAVEVTDQDRPLFEQAVSELMQQLDAPGQTGAALRALLQHFDNDWERLRTLLVGLLQRRGDWGGRLGQHHTPDQAEAELVATLDELVTSVIERVADQLGPDRELLESLTNVAAENLGNPSVLLHARAEALADWQRAAHLLLTKDGKWRSPKGINKTLGFPTEVKAQKALLQAFLEQEPSEALLDALYELRSLPQRSAEDPGWSLVLHLSHLLPVLLAELLLVFQREGRVDYSHIALAAEDALGSDDEPTDLALRLDYQLEHILIDEFQDTSDQQFRLLTKLTRGWAEHNASGHAPRTLFIVGDGMQSIYGFRYANVGLFIEARDHGVGGLSLEPLSLTRNFRSQQGIVAWVNRVFADLLPRADDPARGRVRHVQAEAIHPALDGEAVSSHLFPASDPDAEAIFIAQQIATLRSAEPSCSVAILVRARSHAAPIMAALRARDLPFVGRDLEGLRHTSVVTDLVSLCRWLANPADEVAALALLRAPTCGLRLTDIHALIANKPRPLSLRATLRGALQHNDASFDTDARQRMALLLGALDWADSRRDRLSLPVWVEQVWLRLGGAELLPTGSERDAERFFDLLRAAELAGVGLDMSWIETRLDQLFAEHSVAPHAVELMTLHKSKGLQFDYVFMPTLHRATRGNDRELLRWHLHIGDGRQGLIIAADDRAGSDQPSVYNYLSWLQKQKDAAELRRLLYVGITRARRRVWLSGSGPDESQWPAWPGEKTPLGILRSAIEGATVVHPQSSGTAAQKLWQPMLRRRVLSTATDAQYVPIHEPLAADSFERERLYQSGNRRERVIGTVLHRCLETLSLQTPLPNAVTTTQTAQIEFLLRAEGLGGRGLNEAATRVKDMLANTLADTRGRWILSQHADAASELALVVKNGDAISQRILDRTFVDADTNERWIVDYKTSQPLPNESIDAFCDRECAHYREQLEAYRELMAAYDRPPRTVRLALYFPALPHWLVLD